MTALTRIARDQLSDMRALEPPDGDAAQYERLLTQMQRTLALYPDLRDAVVSEQPLAIESVVTRAESSNRLAGDSALELGLDGCVPDDQPAEG